MAPHHVLSVSQFTSPEKLKHVLSVADEMKSFVENDKDNSFSNLLKGKVLANVFYEPSTRTSVSFQAAMLRLGGSVICVNESSSSVKKGESLQDTMRSMEAYTDVIVLRHPVVGSAATAASVLSIPLLNAGDGTGEHPTQALLDLYTIKNELEKNSLSSSSSVTITMVGDLKHGRTVHSLATLLSTLTPDFLPGKIVLQLISPPSLQMPSSVLDSLVNTSVITGDALTPEIVAASDVIYVTRIQKERFESSEAYDAVRGSYCITSDVMTSAKPSTVLMHPLPRVDEIHVEVDSDPRAAYFRQMRNGMYVRMALLAISLKE